MIAALIPARGGSKGIPDKNLRLVAGKPLIVHTIEQARQTRSIDRVLVSTDSPRIAKVALEHCAEVIWRPPEISGDLATSESALVHALDYLQDREGLVPELVAFLQATSPIRDPNDIELSIQTLRSEDADSLLSVGPIHGFVWHCAKGKVTPANYDPTYRPRRQDLTEEMIVENGSIYLFKPWVLRKFHSRLGGVIAIYRMTALQSFQVDEPADLEIVESILSLGQRNGTPRTSWKNIKLLVLDFDGVMTDNRVLVSEDGTEAVICNRSDGLGIELLRKAGVTICVISKEKNLLVSVRCRKLGIPCIQGCDAKLDALLNIAKEQGLAPDQIAYAGNDINDLDCLRWAGLPIGIADSHPEVRAVAQWMTVQRGGHGAVREICDAILKHVSVPAS